MRKYLMLTTVALVGLLALSAGAITTYDWQSDGDSTAGYMVYLYYNSGSTLPTQIGPGGAANNGWTYSGISDSVADNGKQGINFADETFTVAASGGDVQDGYYVVTILFDGSTITPGVTQWTYLSTVAGNTPLQVSDTELPEEYTVSMTPNGWTTVVPEPGSMALFGLGLVTVLAGRKMLKK